MMYLFAPAIYFATIAVCALTLKVCAKVLEKRAAKRRHEVLESMTRSASRWS